MGRLRVAMGVVADESMVDRMLLLDVLNNPL